MKLKKLMSLSLITPIALITPFVVSSCSEALPEGDTTKGEQTDLLESDESKILVLDNWLTSTYTAVYASTIKKEETTEVQTKIKNSLEYYLTNFTWPTGDEYSTETEFTNVERQTFASSLKETYKFYISYMSTIKTSSNTSPSTYFKIKKFDWIKNQYTTIIPITNQAGKLISISDINFGIGYTGCDASGIVIEDDFKVLMATRGTLVYQNVLKMLLSEMYFLHATENFVKNGTNFNSLTNKINTVNYINTMAYVGENNDFSTYLLKKYLVESSPVFKWSYSSSDYSVLLSDSSIVSTIDQFNNIKTTKESTIVESLVINSNESQSNNISKIQAFDSLLFLGTQEQNDDGSGDSDSTSSETKEGDLSINIEEIKSFGNSKLGLWDSDSKKTFSFTEIEAIKKAFQLNKEGQSLSIPSINIKEQSGWKTSHSIEFDDLNVSWSGGESSGEVAGADQTFKNGNQELKINSISYLPSSSNDKSIIIDFTYSFTSSNQKYSFDYSFVCSNWWDDESEETNQFKNPYIFSGDPDSIGIKLFNDSSEPLGISYYMRILPLFKKESAIPIGQNAEWYMRGKFTFEGTQWNSIEQQKRLAYWFVLSDSTLYSKIQNFYLFNNFNIEGNISEIESVINELGLTKKTDVDRESEGII